MKVDLCDLRRQFRAYFFAKDRDITMQVNRVIVVDGGAVVDDSLTFVGMITAWSGAIVAIPGGWQLCDGTNSTPDLRDRFIIGAGSTYAVDDTGGSTTKDISHLHAAGTLAADSNGAHTHNITGTSGNESSHTHTSGSYATDSDSHTHGVGSYATDTEPHHSHLIAAEAAHLHGAGSLVTGVPSATTNYGEGPDGPSKATGTHTHDVSGVTGNASSHNHGGVSGTDGGHSHSLDSGTSANDSHSHDVTGTSSTGSSHSHSDGSYATASDGAHVHTISGNTATGGSVAQDIMPPWYALAWIMRVS